MSARDHVIILGGGVAGLAAAAALSRAGLGITVLEARSRLGGRIHTVRQLGWPQPIELGAELVHGRDPALLRLLRAARMPLTPTQDRRYAHERGGWRDRDRDFAAVEQLLGQADVDLAIDAYLRAQPGLSPSLRRLARAFVAGFDAADPARASALAIARQMQAAARIDGDVATRPLAGYDALITHLAATLPSEAIHLGTRATRVTWSRRGVTVEARTALDRHARFRARRAVITLPLPMLQRSKGGLAFSPALPPDKRHALSQLAMGAVVKLVLLFRVPPWERFERRHGPLRMLHAWADPFPTWWRLPVAAPTLVAWAGGPAADALAGLPAIDLARRALRSLARLLDRPLATLDAEVQSWHLADWAADPFTRGAYSWLPVGSLAAPSVLSTPVANTLYFAGEACHPDACGTIHGALATAHTAATALLSAL